MTTDEQDAQGSGGMTGELKLEWVKDGVEDWKAVTPYGTYYCIRTFSDMSALWLDNKKLGNYGGGSHAEAKKAAQAHFNGHRPAALAASPEVQALIREAEACGMERAAEMIMPYVPKMFSVVIYEGTYTDGVTKFPVPFVDFGIGVEPEDAHALGIQMTHKDNRWSGLSYTRNDEMRDTEEAVLKKALEPLEAAIRAEAAAIRGEGK